MPMKRPSWDNEHERFEIKRSNHQAAYRLDGARADLAQECFSRLRRAAIGIPKPGAGSRPLRHAQEPPWRAGNRGVADGNQVSRIASISTLTSLVFRDGRVHSLAAALSLSMPPIVNENADRLAEGVPLRRAGTKVELPFNPTNGSPSLPTAPLPYLALRRPE